MRKMRKFGWGVWSVLLVLFGLCALFLMYPRESLMRKARRLTEWEPRQEAAWQNDDSYWWLSDHEVLFLSVQRASEDARDYIAVRYDINTGMRTHLSALEHELFTHRCNMHTSAWKVSPNGKLLLWNGSDTISGTDPATQHPVSLLTERWYVTSLDGRHTQMWLRRTCDNPNAFWLPDNRRWVEWSEDFSMRNMHSRLEIHYVGAKAVTILNSDLAANYYMPIGMIGPENGLSVSSRVGDGDVTLIRWALTSGIVSQSGKFLPTPGKNGNVEAVVSPQGDRIAWKFGVIPGPYILSGTNFMRHLPSSEAGLYVSRTDGSDMQLIGTFRSPAEELVYLHWTPDGKRLSFAHRGSLYTVPAQ